MDFHGFHQENIKEGHHLDRVNTDNEHIAYTSTCDIFIVKDKKAQAKAALAFELLGLNIRVTALEEYVRFIENQSVLETGENFIDYLRWLTLQPTVETEQTKFHFILSFVLSYFNVICHQTGASNIINVDTGAGHGGKLTIMDIDTKRVLAIRATQRTLSC